MTSFDLQFPLGGTEFLPCAFLSCFVFLEDHKFVFYQHRNKGTALDYKERTGHYSVEWFGPAQIPTGIMTIDRSTDWLALRYFVRNRNELHWLQVSTPDPGETPDPLAERSPSAPQLHAPVAQGVMYRAEIAKPVRF